MMKVAIKKLVAFLIIMYSFCLYSSSYSEQANNFQNNSNLNIYSGKCGPNAEWNLINNTLTISGTGVMTDYQGLTEYAPWYDQKDSIINVVIEPGITTIGDYAFKDCNALKSITIPYGITFIGTFAFYCCDHLTDIEFPNSITEIKYGAFYCCSSLSEFHITEGVKVIGSNAFGGCSQMACVYLPASLESIGLDAFDYCSSLNDVFYNDLYNDINRIDISLGNSALKTSLWHCTDKTDYITSFFSGLCGPDAEWNLIDNTLTISGSGVMTDYQGLTEYAPWYDQKDSIINVVIEPGITTIGNYAFKDCNVLKSITLPYGITIIGTHAFMCCYQLTDIELPNSITEIKFGAFYCCSNLSEFHIPEGVRVIGSNAFGGCSQMASVYLPASLESVGLDAFDYCSSLNDVFYNGLYDDINRSNISLGNSALKTSLWHCTDKTDYITSYFSGKCGPNAEWVLIGNTLTISGSGAMTNYEGLTEYAPWYDLKDLIVNVIVEPGITTIGNYAFKDCHVLESITLPYGITVIGTHAFICCYQLTDIELPNSITELKFGAFYCCSKLTEMHLPEGVRTIGSSAFGGCSQLTKITLPVTIQSIGLDAFSNCVSLSDVYYTGSVELVQSININLGNSDLLNALWHYNSIGINITNKKTLTLPNELVKISEESFSNIKAEVIILPNNCKFIEPRAFSNNPQLKYIYIPSSVTNISEDAFSGCNHLIIIGTIPSIAEQYASAHGFGFVTE